LGTVDPRKKSLKYKEFLPSINPLKAIKKREPKMKIEKGFLLFLFLLAAGCAPALAQTPDKTFAQIVGLFEGTSKKTDQK